MKRLLSIFCLYSFFSSSVGANDELEFGKEAADEYILKRTNKLTNPDGRFIGLMAGHSLTSSAYNWGDKQCSDKCKGVGRLQTGLIYGTRLNWKSVDLLWRSTVHFFNLKDEYEPMSFSVKPTLVFPEFRSQIPVYFGVGAGIGMFIKQAFETSAISIDLDMFAGFRWSNLLGPIGFFAEFGLQSKIFLLHRGRFNSGYAAAGLGVNF